MMGKEHIGQTVHVIYDAATIMFFGPQGTEIISHPRPPKVTPMSATASAPASPPTP
jgi:putative transposase